MKVLRYVVLVALILFIFASRSLVGITTDWWWYQEIGNTPFFLKSIWIKVLLFCVTFLIVWLPAYLSIFFARRLAPLRIRVVEGNILEFPDHLIRPYLFPLLHGVAALIALLTAAGVTANWTLILPLFHPVAFGAQDPIFHRDLSAYVFYLPILEMGYQIVLTAILLALAMAVVSYAIQKVLRLGMDGLKMAPVVSIHLSILLCGFALTKAFGYWIGRYELLLAQSGSVFGIGYADFHARLPLLGMMSGIAVAAALFFLINIKLQNWKPMIGVVIVWAIVSAGFFVYPRVIQQIQVLPSELDKERPFLANNIAFTRKAYDLESVKESRVEPVETLSPQNEKIDQPTLQNIRLWDRDPLLKSLSQLQEIRPYYTFKTVDVDRYMMNGNLRQVMISARELDYGRLQNPTWANEHLIFTHGYGFVATPVNQVTSEGLPDFFVENIPPAGSPELKTNNPQIYYGESEDTYSIVNSKQQEFDYPSGDENKYTHYQGTGGIPLDSNWKRLAFASRFSFKIFFSSDIDAKSRILYHRPVLERLNAAFPLFLYDSDPYLVVNQGKLYWICDAYTVNDHYPYAHPVQFHGDEYNYVRNPAKAVIDAYNGTVTYYVSDPTDPILQVYRSVFPQLFRPLSDMPPGLVAHIRVPEDYFLVQGLVYSLYHMTTPDVFYNREDQWQLPHPAGDEEIRPYHVIMQLPGSNAPEFLLMLPFTPSKKDNLAAWMAARCDPAHYGEKLAFEFPKESLVYGPSQIQARINQDPKFSQLRTLWGQQGSRITLGHLQVIPVGNAILYVEPLYLKAEHRELPELKLVLLAFGNRIVMEDSLEKALVAVFKTRMSAASPIPSSVMPKAANDATLTEALAHYNKAIEYQKNGDWTNYGIEIRKLGDVLKKLSGQP